MKLSEDQTARSGVLEGGTRDKILEAARLEFIKRGYDGARVQRIAELSGANKAMIYYYFSSKSNLYRMVLRKEALLKIKKIRKITQSDEPVEHKIRNLISFYVREFGSDAGFLRLVMRELVGGGEVIGGIFAELRKEPQEFDFPGEIFERIFAEGTRNKSLRPVDHRHTLISLIGMSVGYFILRPVADTILGMNENDSAAFAEARGEHITDLLMHGVMQRKKEDEKCRKKKHLILRSKFF